ncbi:hypothetical protein GCM10023185_08250 [Hymenobacter saemangeumensis]|uniref:Lipocalin-like domain-containing protein n=1 Tax=Hymenobacter saemangeumensis TaxID=1084522 RepID=A0ABP8I3V4_9BACT
MKTKPFSPFHYLATFLLLLSFLTISCGNDKGKVEGVNMLYGTDSKVWKTSKELDASGDKVKQTDDQKEERLQMFANGTFTLTRPSGAMSGNYTFDQAGKTITLTPSGSATSMTFTVETLTDDKLTLVGTDGSRMLLKAD